MECQGCWWWLEGGVAAAELVALVIDPELVAVPLVMVGLMFARQGRREEGAWAVEQGWLLVLVIRAVFEGQMIAAVVEVADLVVDSEPAGVLWMMAVLVFALEGRREQGARVADHERWLVLVIRAGFEGQSEPVCCA